MLQEVVSLWPTGPNVTLGTYLVLGRYGFALVLLAWLVLFARRPDSRALVPGLLAVSLAATAFILRPLGRIYGLVDGSEVWHELAQSMAVAVRRDVIEGQWVDSVQAYPLWSGLLATMSGFDAERLLVLYRWLPLIAPVFLALAIYFALSTEPADGSSTRLTRRVRGVTGVFFVLFLASPRLGFLDPDGIFAVAVFWSRPVQAFGLALAWIGIGLVLRSSRWWVLALVGVGIGLVSGSLALLSAVTALVVLTLTRLRKTPSLSGRGASVVSLLVGLGLGWAVLARPAVVFGPPPDLRWTDAAFSLSFDYGLWFYLAVAAAILSWARERLSLGSLSSAVVMTGLVACVSGAIFPALFGYVEWSWCFRWARLGILVLASDGFLRGIDWLFDRRQHLGIGLLARLEFPGFLALALVGTLPFCFPFWFLPHQMDSHYRESRLAVSRQLVAAMGAVRDETDPAAVFLAGPGYSQAIASLSGRRVLLTPGAPPPPDREDRERFARWLLESTSTASPEVSFPVDHVASGRLDDAHGFTISWDRLARERGVSLVFSQRQFIRVGRMARSAGAPE